MKTRPVSTPSGNLCTVGPMSFVQLDHPRFKKVDIDIFYSRLSPSCLDHECKIVREQPKGMADACCQYGVDVDLSERDNILQKREEIKALLFDKEASAEWFKTEVNEDPDFPTGQFVRTQRSGDGCIFLQHDKRGCAIHRAAIEGGWSFDKIKPHVCRLFPVSYTSDSIVISDDYADYSCAYENTAPTIYDVQRGELLEIFGEELVLALDSLRDSLPKRKLLTVI